MDDLISRAAAIGCLGNSPEQICMPWSEVEKILRELPAVDAAPVVHGRWYDKGSLSCRCSCCGCKSNKEYNYCPNCGAKMDERRSENA